MTLRSVLLVAGRVAAPAAAPIEGEQHRGLILTVEEYGEHSAWSILLSTPEAEAEAGDLAKGEVVAFVGVPISATAAAPGRGLKAFRALTLRNREAREPVHAPNAPTSFDGRQAFEATLDRLESAAARLGAAFEHARIATIMNAPDATGRLALAWSLAESGLQVRESLEALAVAKVAAAFPPHDPGAALTH